MANETKTEPRRPRRWLRRAGIILGGLLLLVVLAYFVGTSEWALKSVILPRVSKSMNAQVTVDGANISPFSSVTLRGLIVQTKGTEPLVTAQEVRARYRLMDIIRGNLNVSEVVLESPVVNLITFPDGTSNLDPIIGAPKDQKPHDPKPKGQKDGKPAQLNLGRFALNNATVRKIDQHKDGTREIIELTGVNVTAEDIGNNKTGQLGLAANVRMDHGLNSASNGVLVATVGGKFNLQLDAALKPQVAKGQTKVHVTEAKGAFAQVAGLGVTLNTDLTPTQLNDVSVRFAQNGKPLGAMTASGPFNAETMEGKLVVTISQIDRQVLNLAGATLGMDFNQTAINSTNTIELAQKGSVIRVNGQLVVGNFSVTQMGQTTPPVDLRTGYAVTYEKANETALVQTFTLQGLQNNVEFLRGTLARPMRLELGKASGAVDESAFDLVLTNFNLPDWRAFLGTNVNLTSGRAGMNLHLVSRQAGKELLLTGQANVAEMTGAFQSNRFDRFATAVDLDTAVRGPAVEIKRLAGTLQQSGQPGGAFEVAGNYDLSNKTGLITATLNNLNQHVLKSFLAAALGDKQLESVVINSKTTANLNGANSLAVKTEFHMANLVVTDPSGRVPKTPLALDLTADVARAGEIVDLRAVQLALTKTDRAPNSLHVAGRVDMSKSNAWTGNLKITSEGLDVTPYYDLFADNKSKPATTTTTGRRRSPQEAVPEIEPPPMSLPFTQFTEEMNIAKFFLREVAISNLVSKVVIENGRVTVNPFALTLNGAPASLTASVNLGVAGYQYDVNAKLDGVPVEPLVNTFAPDNRGQVKGDLFTSAQIKGAGITGPNVKKNLAGQLGLTLTNANVQVTKYKPLQQILGPISSALRIPQLAESPLNWIDARATIAGGTVTLPAVTAESSVFRLALNGTVTMDEVLTNSVLNNLPAEIALRRNIADAARLTPPGTPTNAQFIPLPTFVRVAGTVGDPKSQIDKMAVARLLAGAVGNYVGGDAGRILRGLGNLGGASTNATGTNAASTNAIGNLLQGIGNILQKPPKTNAPDDKKGGFKLNDVLK
jgi:hypothetical protein